MKKILAAALFALCAVCAQAKPFSPEQYAKVLREYNSVAGANDYFESGKFKEEFNKQEHGIMVAEFNDVFKFLTTPAVKWAIEELVTIVRKQHLSTAGIEVAGIIAYKQPITRSMISNIRGVVSDHIVASLLTKGIIEEVGVAPTPGNPILYGITNKFYDYFKIKTLAELPPFPEFARYKDESEEMEDKEFNLFDSQRQDEKSQSPSILVAEGDDDDQEI